MYEEGEFWQGAVAECQHHMSTLTAHRDFPVGGERLHHHDIIYSMTSLNIKTIQCYFP